MSWRPWSLSRTAKPPVGYGINYGNPFSPGVIGCWLFNEGGGTVLNSSLPGVSPFITNNKPTWQGNRGVQFLASSRQSATAVNGPNIANGPFSITTRFQCLDTGGNGGVLMAGNSFDGVDQFLHLRATNANTFRFGLYFDDLDITTPFDLTQTYHTCTFTMDVNKVQSVYFDSVFMGSATAGSFFTGNNTWRICGNDIQDVTSDFSACNVAYVIVHNWCLDFSQVVQFQAAPFQIIQNRGRPWTINFPPDPPLIFTGIFGQNYFSQYGEIEYAAVPKVPLHCNIKSGSSVRATATVTGGVVVNAACHIVSGSSVAVKSRARLRDAVTSGSSVSPKSQSRLRDAVVTGSAVTATPKALARAAVIPGSSVAAKSQSRLRDAITSGSAVTATATVTGGGVVVVACHVVSGSSVAAKGQSRLRAAVVSGSAVTATTKPLVRAAITSGSSVAAKGQSRLMASIVTGSAVTATPKALARAAITSGSAASARSRSRIRAAITSGSSFAGTIPSHGVIAAAHIVAGSSLSAHALARLRDAIVTGSSLTAAGKVPRCLTAELTGLDRLTAELTGLDRLTADLTGVDRLTADVSAKDRLTAALSGVDRLTAEVTACGN